MSLRLGIDLGGTKIAAIVLDAQGGVRWESRAATPRHDYDARIAAIGDLVREGERAVGAACTVGVGIPGTTSPATGLIKNANSTWLIGHPLQRDLEAHLAREVRMANDANCFAVSEATDGAAAGADVVFGVILGTGTGAGVVVHGKVLTGVNAIAGEWGHNALPAPKDDERDGQMWCCGRHGCGGTVLCWRCLGGRA